MDVDKLLSALNNDQNEDIVDLDFATIATNKNKILQQLNLKRAELVLFQKKLKDYRYIEELKDLKFGSYIRWISLKNPEQLKLTNGGIICDIKNINNDIHIKCKNKMNMLFQIKLSEVIVFQKLTNQETIILTAMNYLEK
jgi:hypothetical protein